MWAPRAAIIMQCNGEHPLPVFPRRIIMRDSGPFSMNYARILSTFSVFLWENMRGSALK